MKNTIDDNLYFDLIQDLFFILIYRNIENISGIFIWYIFFSLLFHMYIIIGIIIYWTNSFWRVCNKNNNTPILNLHKISRLTLDRFKWTEREREREREREKKSERESIKIRFSWLRSKITNWIAIKNDTIDSS